MRDKSVLKAAIALRAKAAFFIRAKCGSGEEIEDAALKFGGLVAESGGMERFGYDPYLFGANCSSEYFLGVPAGKNSVISVANEEDGKVAGSHSLFRGDFRGGKSGE